MLVRALPAELAAIRWSLGRQTVLGRHTLLGRSDHLLHLLLALVLGLPRVVVIELNIAVGRRLTEV